MTTSDERAPARGGPVVWWALAALATVLAAWLATDVRSAVRAGGSGDFGTVYAAARAGHGGDPYDQRRLDREWAAARGSPGVAPSAYWTPSVYPPGTMLVVAPIAAALPWPAARAVWTVLDVGLVVGLFAVLPSLAGLRWTDARGMALVAAALLMGPARAGVAMGQPVVATTALIVLAAWAAGKDRDGLAGVLLLVATSLKPQVAGPFVAYYLLRRRWLLVGIAAGGFAALTLAAAARLSAAGVPWVAGLSANVRAASGPGGINDPTWLGPNRFSMVNLQILLHTATDNRPLVTALTAGLLAAAALAFAVIVLRGDRADLAAAPSTPRAGLPARGLAELAFVGTWSLLAVYHRWYDGELLILVLAWAAAAVPARRWTTAAVAAALLTVPFVASVALKFLPGRRTVPQRHSLLMEHLVLPNQCWALCLLAGLLLVVLWRRPATQVRQTSMPRIFN